MAVPAARQQPPPEPTPLDRDDDDDAAPPSEGFVTWLFGVGSSVWPFVRTELTVCVVATLVMITAAIVSAPAVCPPARCTLLNEAISRWLYLVAASLLISIPGRICDRFFFAAVATVGQWLTLSMLLPIFFYISAFEGSLSRMWWLSMVWTISDSFLALRDADAAVFDDIMRSLLAFQLLSIARQLALRVTMRTVLIGSFEQRIQEALFQNLIVLTLGQGHVLDAPTGRMVPLRRQTALRELLRMYRAEDFRSKLDFVSKVRFRLFAKSGDVVALAKKEPIAVFAKAAFKKLARLPPHVLVEVERKTEQITSLTSLSDLRQALGGGGPAAAFRRPTAAFGGARSDDALMMAAAADASPGGSTPHEDSEWQGAAARLSHDSGGGVAVGGGDGLARSPTLGTSDRLPVGAPSPQGSAAASAGGRRGRAGTSTGAMLGELLGRAVEHVKEAVHGSIGGGGSGGSGGGSVIGVRTSSFVASTRSMRFGSSGSLTGGGGSGGGGSGGLTGLSPARDTTSVAVDDARREASGELPLSAAVWGGGAPVDTTAMADFSHVAALGRRDGSGSGAGGSLESVPETSLESMPEQETAPPQPPSRLQLQPRQSSRSLTASTFSPPDAASTHAPASAGESASGSSSDPWSQRGSVALPESERMPPSSFTEPPRGGFYAAGGAAGGHASGAAATAVAASHSGSHTPAVRFDLNAELGSVNPGGVATAGLSAGAARTRASALPPAALPPGALVSLAADRTSSSSSSSSSGGGGGVGESGIGDAYRHHSAGALNRLLRGGGGGGGGGDDQHASRSIGVTVGRLLREQLRGVLHAYVPREELEEVASYFGDGTRQPEDAAAAAMAVGLGAHDARAGHAIAHSSSGGARVGHPAAATSGSGSGGGSGGVSSTGGAPSTVAAAHTSGATSHNQHHRHLAQAAEAVAGPVAATATAAGGAGGWASGGGGESMPPQPPLPFGDEPGGAAPLPPREYPKLRLAHFAALIEADSGLDPEKAFCLFDTNNDGLVSLEEFQHACESIYEELRLLKAALSGHQTVSTAMQSLLDVVFWCLLTFFTLLIFDVPVVQVYIPLGTVLVSASFAIGASISQVVSSLIFVLVTRPYNCGDRVTASGVFGGEETLVVKTVDVLTTSFLRLTNKQVTVPNWALCNMAIENFKRSPAAVMKVELAVGSATSAAQLEALRRRLDGYLTSQPLAWKPTCVIRCSGLRDQALLLSVWCSSHYMWQDGPRLYRASFLLHLALVEFLRDTGIAFRLADQSLRLEGTLCTRALPAEEAGSGGGAGGGAGGKAVEAMGATGAASPGGSDPDGGGGERPRRLQPMSERGAEAAVVTSTSAVATAVEPSRLEPAAASAVEPPGPAQAPPGLGPQQLAAILQQLQAVQQAQGSLFAALAAAVGSPASAREA